LPPKGPPLPDRGKLINYRLWPMSAAKAGSAPLLDATVQLMPAPFNCGAKLIQIGIPGPRKKTPILKKPADARPPIKFDAAGDVSGSMHSKTSAAGAPASETALLEERSDRYGGDRGSIAGAPPVKCWPPDAGLSDKQQIVSRRLKPAGVAGQAWAGEGLRLGHSLASRA